MNLPTLHAFFENPRSRAAKITHIILIFAILFSVGSAFIEIEFPYIAERFPYFFGISEKIILILFSTEYILRFISAPKKWNFFWQPFNLIDLFAILPFFFGINASAARILRLLRLLKLARHLHILEIFHFRGTILQKIFPLLLVLSGIKLFIWLLESQKLWFSADGLGQLFAIIGFALGIILAQKIATTSGKYFSIRESFFRISSIIQSLAGFFPQEKEFFIQWLKKVLEIFHHTKKGVSDIFQENKKLLHIIKKYESPPSEMAVLAKDLITEADYGLPQLSPIETKKRVNMVLYHFLI